MPCVVGAVTRAASGRGDVVLGAKRESAGATRSVTPAPSGRYATCTRCSSREPRPASFPGRRRRSPCPARHVAGRVSTGGARTLRRRAPRRASAAAARYPIVRRVGGAGISGATRSTPPGSLPAPAIWPETATAWSVAARAGDEGCACSRRSGSRCSRLRICWSSGARAATARPSERAWASARATAEGLRPRGTHAIPTRAGSLPTDSPV
jgi:hypothetical protein